jgi:hypothetical protein
MARRALKSFWFLIALLFLIEAWIWDCVQPIIAALLRLVPYEALKAALARAIARLPAALVIFVFILPDALSYPVQFIGLWIAAKGAIVTGTVIFGVAKLLGLAGTLLLFEVCRDKLEELAWYRWVAGQVARARAWARDQVEPAMARLRALRRHIARELNVRFGRGRFSVHARRLRAGLMRRWRKSGGGGAA